MIFHSSSSCIFKKKKKKLLSVWTTHHSISCPLWNLRQDLLHSIPQEQSSTESVDMTVVDLDPTMDREPHLDIDLDPKTLGRTKLQQANNHRLLFLYRTFTSVVRNPAMPVCQRREDWLTPSLHARLMIDLYIGKTCSRQRKIKKQSYSFGHPEVNCFQIWTMDKVRAYRYIYVSGADHTILLKEEFNLKFFYFSWRTNLNVRPKACWVWPILSEVVECVPMPHAKTNRQRFNNSSVASDVGSGPDGF